MIFLLGLAPRVASAAGERIAIVGAEGSADLTQRMRRELAVFGFDVVSTNEGGLAGVMAQGTPSAIARVSERGRTVEIWTRAEDHGWRGPKVLTEESAGSPDLLTLRSVELIRSAVLFPGDDPITEDNASEAADAEHRTAGGRPTTRVGIGFGQLFSPPFEPAFAVVAQGSWQVFGRFSAGLIAVMTPSQRSSWQDGEIEHSQFIGAVQGGGSIELDQFVFEWSALLGGNRIWLSYEVPRPKHNTSERMDVGLAGATLALGYRATPWLQLQLQTLAALHLSSIRFELEPEGRRKPGDERAGPELNVAPAVCLFATTVNFSF